MGLNNSKKYHNKGLFNTKKGDKQIILISQIEYFMLNKYQICINKPFKYYIFLF